MPMCDQFGFHLWRIVAVSNRMTALNQLAAVLLSLAVFASRANGERDILTIIMNSEPVQQAIEVRLQTNLISAPTIPPPDKDAEMARFIVHYSLWGSLAHISLQPQTNGSPLARVYSISDGPMNKSSGVPYFFMTPNDPELIDMFKDNRASLTMTLAQTPYCRAKALDPEDPRCAQVILTGKFIPLKNSTAEWGQAKEAMFSRHPIMKSWPGGHHWLFCKLEIKSILVVDSFGGNKYPSVEDYFKASPNICSSNNPMLEMAFY